MFELALATGATFTADECAAIAGCLPKTWLSMVTRRFAPPSRGFSPESGERVWDVDEILKWQAARPGRGNWAKGKERSLRHAHNRARTYSFGGHPAFKEKTVFVNPDLDFYVPPVKSGLPPRLPFIPR